MEEKNPSCLCPHSLTHSPFYKGRSGVSDSRLNSINTDAVQFLPILLGGGECVKACEVGRGWIFLILFS